MLGSLADRLFHTAVLVFGWLTYDYPSSALCDTVWQGYQCRPEISHFWGQYSPWFSVKSDISAEIPNQCTITFAQVLSRHGARDPTWDRSNAYRNLTDRIHRNVHHYSSKYSFLQDYKYGLGHDQLTSFGEQELVNSGINFFERYKQLSLVSTPFVRASDQHRVVMSAEKWIQGFQQAMSDDHTLVQAQSLPILKISEEPGQNNTLSISNCEAFEKNKWSRNSSNADEKWRSFFIPPIQARLNTDLAGANLSRDETLEVMDLCPFSTVASLSGSVSPFCDLFTESEWQQYDHYQALAKYYQNGAGAALGPTQGVGWTNELIARLTQKPVQDDTSTNHTLDGNHDTFPLNRTLYADFSHDNDMVSIFYAMNLYNLTNLSTQSKSTTTDALGTFLSSTTVPFAARAYVEKMRCDDSPAQEMVRVIVNDRVMPLESCGGDVLGRCLLSDFIESLTWARQGGDWEKCSA